MRIAYEVIGDKVKAVALIGEDVKNPKKAAKEIMERQGKYRLHPYKLIKGSRDTEVIHKEYNYLIKVDPQKVYFSPREGTERQRIVELVKNGERILVMFAGAAPYAIAIAKKYPHNEILNIEINMKAVEYAQKNVRMNRLTNIKNICWDVREARGIGKFERIIMPLPETAIDFLDEAVLHSKKGTIIHLYGFAKDFEEFERKVKLKAYVYNFKYKIVGKQKVLPYAPRVSKLRLDIKIL